MLGLISMLRSGFARPVLGTPDHGRQLRGTPDAGATVAADGMNAASPSAGATGQDVTAGDAEEPDAHTVITQVEEMQREISSRRIRELERLADRILVGEGSHCDELSQVLARFDEWRNALLPWLIREQYLLLPIIKQKMAAHAGGDSEEAYVGEYADIARNAAADHNFLLMLSDELDRELAVLKGKESCPPSIARFSYAFGKFAEYLRAECHVEDNKLLPRFMGHQTER